MEQSLNLQMAVIPQSFLDSLVEKIERLESFLNQKINKSNDFEWIESDQARKLLGVCRKTWQTYRDKRYIPFSQFGNKIYVRRSDLNAFMEANYIKSR